jgi:hypothetical protein
MVRVCPRHSSSLSVKRAGVFLFSDKFMIHMIDFACLSILQRMSCIKHQVERSSDIETKGIVSGLRLGYNFFLQIFDEYIIAALEIWQQGEQTSMKIMSNSKIGLIRMSTIIVCAMAGCVLGAFWLVGCQTAPSVGNFPVEAIVPANGQPFSVAISADGTEVAMMYQTSTSPRITTDAIEVRDARSGREVKTFSLPTVNWAKTKHQFYLSRPLSYCDGGKYLLAFTGPDNLEVFDAHSFQLHASIVLSDLHPRVKGQPTSKSFGEMQLSTNVGADCSVSNGAAALVFWGDLQPFSIKLFDLDTGLETADLAGSYERTGRVSSFRRYQGDGIAISPDGSKIALLTWQWGGDEGSGVDVLDVRTGAQFKRLFLGDPSTIRHRLTFAGNDALIIGQRSCPVNDVCDYENLPSGRTLRVWNFGTDGSVKTLSLPGKEIYNSFGAPADGSVVFGYTGDESYCKTCNDGHGELRITEARFAVWDRRSGKVILRSPELRIEHHTCGFLVFGCDSYDQSPELQMSANGEAILAFWPSGDPPPDKKKGVGELQVFPVHLDSPPPSNARD